MSKHGNQMAVRYNLLFTDDNAVIITNVILGKWNYKDIAIRYLVYFDDDNIAKKLLTLL